MTYDIIDQCSIRPAAALGSPLCASGLAATLPRLCRPEPALAETLAPYPLRLRDRHHAGTAPAVALIRRSCRSWSTSSALKSGW